VIRTFVDKAIAEAMALRAKIPDLANSDDVREKRQLLRDADDALAKVRMVGDAVVASFFSEEKPKARTEARERLETRVQTWLSGRDSTPELEALVAELRGGERPVPCFHWEVEFAEIFVRQSKGFDAFVGNPPFLGGKRISTSYGHGFADWLTVMFAGATGNADLVSFFFRRTFQLLRQGGTQGLIATKTIAEGDTRATGLRWLREHGATIYNAKKRLRWPGKAAVIVSPVAIRKEAGVSSVELDCKVVDAITAFLFHRGGDRDPRRFGGENGKAFIGCFLRGMGFTFDDSNDEATPIAEFARLSKVYTNIDKVVRPYLGGEEVLDHPEHSPHRYAICLSGMTESEARRMWPDLMQILEKKVKPARACLGNSAVDKVHKERWWLFANDRPELRAASQSLSRIIAIPRVSSHLCVAFLPTRYILSDQLVALAFSQVAMFAIVQSRVHEAWARFFSSTMGEGLRYAPSDCFETFPLPEEWETPHLTDVGEAYFSTRATHLVRTREGLTKTYNRFHDPGESEAAIQRLRELHTAMDRAVLDAYGWTDIQPTCEFLLDYEEEDDDAEASGGRRKKKPWRYRWPDDVRDEVLARLLELNARRAKEQAGTPPPGGQGTPPATGKKPRGRGKAKKPTPAGQGGLFGEESD
jgi:hypothetical protein